MFDPENRGAQAYRDLANEVLGNELDLDDDMPSEKPAEMTADEPVGTNEQQTLSRVEEPELQSITPSHSTEDEE